MSLRNTILALGAGLIGYMVNNQWEHLRAHEIKNKVVIITGASSGIGRATAHTFAANGACTVLVARRANMLATLQEELEQQYGAQSLTIAADITQDDDIERVVRDTLDHFGHIDVLVNNAGVTQGGTLEEISPETMQTMLDVNLYGAMRLTQQVLPTLRQQKSGHIVNVGSIASLTFTPGQQVYAATKAGLYGFSQGMRRELAGSGVHVALVMPGFTDTPMINHLDKASTNGLPVQTPEFVASHIVGAVRYNWNNVVLGGMTSKALTLIDRLSPRLLDWVFRANGRDKSIEMMRQTG